MSIKSIYTEEHQLVIQRLKKARENTGLTQLEVAKKLGRNRSYIAKIETGQRRIDIVELSQLAKIYKKSICYFHKVIG